MTDEWDESKPEHKRIAHGIEVGDGIPEMRTLHDARKALKTVGFEITHEEDLAARPDVVPWYYPLEGDIWKAQTVWDMFTVFRMSRLGKVITQNGVWGLEKVGFVPKGTFDVGESLKVAAEALVAGGKAKLFTPMALWICRKVCVLLGVEARTELLTFSSLPTRLCFWDLDLVVLQCYACTVYVFVLSLSSLRRACWSWSA